MNINKIKDLKKLILKIENVFFFYFNRHNFYHR